MTMRAKHNLLDLYPLTPIQQGILFHSLASEGDDPYLVRVCFRLDGAVDPDALQRAWQIVVDRHEALRADLEWIKSKQPIQLVFRRCPVTLEHLDWHDVPAADVDPRLRALVQTEARRFSLQRTADQRILLIRTSPERGFLLWVFHHVLLDGWSVTNILAEVLYAYRAAAGGAVADLPAVPPYASYLAWLRAQDVASADAYWRAALADHDAPMFPPPPMTAAKPRNRRSMPAEHGAESVARPSLPDHTRPSTGDVPESSPSEHPTDRARSAAGVSAESARGAGRSSRSPSLAETTRPAPTASAASPTSESPTDRARSAAGVSAESERGEGRSSQSASLAETTRTAPTASEASPSSESLTDRVRSAAGVSAESERGEGRSSQSASLAETIRPAPSASAASPTSESPTGIARSAAGVSAESSRDESRSLPGESHPANQPNARDPSRSAAGVSAESSRDESRSFRSANPVEVIRSAAGASAESSHIDSDPSDHGGASQRYAERSVSFDETESTRLRTLASQARVTLSTCFRGALALLIREYTGRDDVVFGATVAGRPADLAGATAMVGAFINTVPVRVRLRSRDRLVPWLQTLHREAGQRQAFEHLGLPRIQELAAQPTGQPLFESILVFENVPIAAVLEQADALPFAVEPYPVFGSASGVTVGRGRNNYPISFVVLPGRRIELIVAYHRDRVTDTCAAAMLQRLAAIVRSLTATPDATLLGVLDAAAHLAEPSQATNNAPLVSDRRSTATHETRALAIHGPSGAPRAEEPGSEPGPSPALTIPDQRSAPRAGEPTTASSPCTRDDAAPTTCSIHERIAHWVNATPEALAVQCEHQTLTYAELEALANHLAYHLQALGVGIGTHVGLCLPRSVDFVVALYATLKCGAAYVPVEPDHPRARLAGLFDDAALVAVVTTRAHIPALTSLHPTLVCCDDLAITDPPRISVPVHPESPAYLVYTSGSTGQPKGVVVSHRALDNYVTGVTDRLDLPAGAGMAMVSTVAADLGHTALFGALCTGRALHLLTEERALDPDGFADYMSRHPVAALKIVPGHLWGLLQTGAPDRALPTHALVIGGEAAPPPLLAHLRRQTRCRVINHYGPTETTVGILTHEIAAPDRMPEDRAVDPDEHAPLPLGHPLPHSRAHVLGPDLRPMPRGAAGEIYLGGRGLAAGYFRRPALTAERFVPDPLSREPGARLYRTGDRGHVRDDGAIEFLGRADDQIKLRGFRIELGEIRAALLRLPGVSDARVVVRPGPAASPQLCAYLIGAAVPAGRLDAQLRARLPEPMIPSAYVWLDQFPITANGKIDLARLPAPGDTAAAGAPAQPRVEPTTEPARILAAIWQEILGCAHVGVDDNFFHLGGDSILALKVVARARRAGWKLTPKQLFAHPTLAAAAGAAQPIATAVPSTSVDPATAVAAAATAAGIAQPIVITSAEPGRPADAAAAVAPATAATTTAPSALAASTGAVASASSDTHLMSRTFVAATRVPAEPAVRLTPIQHRFLDRQRVDPHHYNQAILLALTEPIAPAALERALAHLTRCHDALRLRFRRDRDRWSAWYADPGTAITSALAHVDLSAAHDLAAAIEHACHELQRSFDLARGPLLRAAYLDLGPGRGARLLLFAHHLVVDGVSWRILLEDLAALITHTGAPDAAVLPPPTTPFQDFAERLHHYRRSTALHDERAYWQRVLAPSGDEGDREPRTRSDQATPAGDPSTNTVGHAITVSAALDGPTTRALLSRAPRAHATQVNDLLLSALALVLCRHERRSSVLVTVEGHGREDLFDGVDLSRTVGWFSTTYPVRLTPAPGGDPGATIDAIKHQLRQVPDNGIGYGLLRYLDPGTALDATEPGVVFNYLGQFDQAFAGQQLFHIASESSGSRRSPHTPRDGWFVINAVVYDHVLRVDWEYSRAHHDRDTIARLVADYLTELRALIRHCNDVLGATP